MVGKLATHSMSHGYLYIKANGRHYSASRLAWELVNGTPVPKNLEIDHINRIRYDNRIVNLRVVDRSTNLFNTKLKPGLTGYVGVTVYSRRNKNGSLYKMYRTRVGGKTVYYPTLKLAVIGYARLAAEATLTDKES
jgi:HNH endonuclease